MVIFLIAYSVFSNVYFLFSSSIPNKLDAPFLGENIKFLILFILWVSVVHLFRCVCVVFICFVASVYGMSIIGYPIGSLTFI